MNIEGQSEEEREELAGENRQMRIGRDRSKEMKLRCRKK